VTLGKSDIGYLHFIALAVLYIVSFAVTVLYGVLWFAPAATFAAAFALFVAVQIRTALGTATLAEIRTFTLAVGEISILGVVSWLVLPLIARTLTQTVQIVAVAEFVLGAGMLCVLYASFNAYQKRMQTDKAVTENTGRLGLLTLDVANVLQDIQLDASENELIVTNCVDNIERAIDNMDGYLTWQEVVSGEMRQIFDSTLKSIYKNAAKEFEKLSESGLAIIDSYARDITEKMTENARLSESAAERFLQEVAKYKAFSADSAKAADSLNYATENLTKMLTPHVKLFQQADALIARASNEFQIFTSQCAHSFNDEMKKQMEIALAQIKKV
jgi:hypothetical protein